MSKKRIIIISIITLIIAGIITGICIYKYKDKKEREILLYNLRLSSVIEFFCVEGKIEGEEDDNKKKMTIKDYKINTKKLATKIYVYVKKHGEFSNMQELYYQYSGDKKNLDGATNGLYIKIYIDNIEDFSPEFQKELEQKQTEIEKIEEWLKNGQLQKLEEWLSKQDF